MLRITLSLLFGSILLTGCVSTDGASSIIAADNPAYVRAGNSDSTPTEDSDAAARARLMIGAQNYDDAAKARTKAAEQQAQQTELTTQPSQ